MSAEKMNDQQRQRLLDSLLDGSIEEAELLLIEAELTIDPEVRQQYYRRLKLDLLLEREAAGACLSGSTTPVIVKPRARRVNPLLSGILIGIAACLLLVVVLDRGRLFSDRADQRTASDAPVEPSATGFAVLKGQTDAVWSQESIAIGDLLPEGPLHLRSGTAHIEFFSGAQLVVAGDAAFSIDSAMQVTMQSGRARAKVPEPAIGFTVKTSSGDIIDLGTEFAFDISDSDAAVRVLDGEVELRPHGQEAQKILGGQTRRIDKSGEVSEFSATDLDLIGPTEFQRLMEGHQRSRIATWQQASGRWRADPDLILCYQFTAEDLHNRKVTNLAGVDGSMISDGAVVAAQHTTDRWGRGGEALDFSRVGSRVRVNVPGEYDGLTLSCWVKINSLDRWYNSLFLTDGHEDREPHWQIMEDGRVFFSVKVPKTDHAEQSEAQHPFYSPAIWDASLSGRWIMLSVTCDLDSQMVTHYLNGTAISSERIPDASLVESIRVGEASICNWNEPMYRTDAKFVVRNLNGSMDEFVMFSRSLSADEILNLYRVGTPDEL